jgi:hypothetical protein
MPGGLAAPAAGRAYQGRSSPTDIDGGQSARHAHAKNPVLHDRSKHINTRFHFIRDCVDGGQIVLEFVESGRQLADILNKPLGQLRFMELRTKIGMVEIKQEKQD